jgi:hypothetical protein
MTQGVTEMIPRRHRTPGERASSTCRPAAIAAGVLAGCEGPPKRCEIVFERRLPGGLPISLAAEAVGTHAL